MNRTADALRHHAPREDTPRSESWPDATPATDAPPSPAFPGCRSFRLTRDAVDHHDGRFEYWDAATETAWVVAEPTSGTHEQPSRRLSALGEVIASLRGGPIECRGSMDLIWNAGQRERRRILQADEAAYLHPARARIPGKTGLVIGEHDLPDVVLEVDHTTDVRRGKLGLYAAWGFPEVWVEVPDVTSPSRPAGRVPGLTIHRLDAGRHRTVAASVAFPGWTAAEIHVALNEPVRSDATDRALERVAGASARATARDPRTPRGSAGSAPKEAGRSATRSCGPSLPGAGWQASNPCWRSATRPACRSPLRSTPSSTAGTPPTSARASPARTGTARRRRGGRRPAGRRDTGGPPER